MHEGVKLHGSSKKNQGKKWNQTSGLVEHGGGGRGRCSCVSHGAGQVLREMTGQQVQKEKGNHKTKTKKGRGGVE